MAASWKYEYFGLELVTKNGLKKTEDILRDKKYIAILFSAEWCPPCRGFTPVLSKFYEAMNDDNEDEMEVIFASSDNDDSVFLESYAEMPWLALPYGSRRISELSKRYNIVGLPSIVVLKGEDGNVVDIDGRGTLIAVKYDVAEAKRKWAETESS